ncbi:SymE family type I addiction module toxin [Enterobacillus tribolii]|uniref:Toxic protein SymE n=1 Tax=Enterobacillus tribolii TaxID=1487935 RepID=A0A370R190_9GAMM|nr:SymE family type I addiction module toxin [Enterobacillus tribolii]MBW7982757.1 type I addiction module toxin, SymE family [Enterobacillus tribolii]RDK95681.1 toxic protein SymE [Enterobacillus tribolii]
MADNVLPTLHISEGERYGEVDYDGILLDGTWLAEAGFPAGMPIKVRIMPDCIVITAQNLRELWGCLSGLSDNEWSPEQSARWLADFPGKLRAVS